MKFEKIIIPPGWQESFTKYPNGRTIFEALTSTITSVNEGIEAVNTKVDQGLLAIDAAANTIRSEVDASFLILQNKLEQDIEYLQDDLVADISVLQSQVNAAVDSVADKVTQSQLDAVNAQLTDKALKTEVGLLSGLLTTAKTSIVNAINELFNSKANKTQEAWITPTLTNGWVPFSDTLSTAGYFKDTIGIVHLRGIIKNGTGALIGFLPVGYRPSKTVYIVTVSNGLFGYLTISTGGAITAMAYSSAWISLENIAFKAEV